MAKDQLQPVHCAEQLKALGEPSRLRIGWSTKPFMGVTVDAEVASQVQRFQDAVLRARASLAVEKAQVRRLLPSADSVVHFRRSRSRLSPSGTFPPSWRLS
jgi:hypothetical protein